MNNLIKVIFLFASCFILCLCIRHFYEPDSEKIKKTVKYVQGIINAYPDGKDSEEQYTMAYNASYKAYLLDSLNKDILMCCGYTAFRLKQFPLAIYYLTKLINIVPPLYAYQLRGVSYMGVGNIDLAKNDFTTFLSIDSTSSRAANIYFQWGLALEQKGDTNQTIQKWTKAIEIDSMHIEYFLARGELYYNIHQLQNAYYDYKTAVSIDSTNKIALNDMGQALVSGHREREGMVYLHKALLSDSLLGISYRNLAVAYYFLHNMDSFCIEMHKSVELGCADEDGYIDKYCKK